MRMVQDAAGKILFSQTLKKEVVLKILEICNRHNADFLIQYPDRICVSEINPNTNFSLQYNEPAPIVVKDLLREMGIMEDPPKVMVVNFDHPEALLHLRDKLNAVLGDHTNIIFFMPPCWNSCQPGFQNLSACALSLASWAIPLEHVIAFETGILMLKCSGMLLGVAVENASPLCKSSANMIVGFKRKPGAGCIPQRFYSLGLKNA